MLGVGVGLVVYYHPYSSESWALTILLDYDMRLA